MFEVEEGEIFAFLGANGSGKTSTIMMLATAVNPSSGTATVCGCDIITERYKVRESRVLLLDEPTLGLDVQARRNLLEYIKVLTGEEGSLKELSKALMTRSRGKR